MGQINFQANINCVGYSNIRGTNRTLYVNPFNVYESISLNTVHIPFRLSVTAQTLTLSLGLYSLSLGTLSLANSASATIRFTGAGNIQYVPITAISATQNITPGTWYWGFVVNSSGSSQFTIQGGASIAPGNAFPGGFTGGRYTVSTLGLPASIPITDFDVTGIDAHYVIPIIISA